MSSPDHGRKPRAGAYLSLFGLCSVLLFILHLPWVGLPYFWDEAGQFVPQALDIFREGALIPHSVTPSIHPPGLMLYLAAIWKVFGYHIAVTRCAMLILAAISIFITFLLAIELLKDAPGMHALLATGLLALSPLFFAQALMAQLDAPAMLLTAAALLLFVKDRLPACASVCSALVLTKETGLAVPLVFAGYLLWERRWRDALWLAVPVAALGVWVGVLTHVTGSWAGDPGFAEYNLRYPLHPVRITVNLLRRLYYLGAWSSSSPSVRLPQNRQRSRL